MASCNSHRRQHPAGDRPCRLLADALGAHLAIEALGVRIRADLEVLDRGGGRRGLSVLPHVRAEAGADLARSARSLSILAFSPLGSAGSSLRDKLRADR
jgi:hypothetical protein